LKKVENLLYEEDNTYSLIKKTDSTQN